MTDYAWCQNRTWNPEISEAFEKKLKRARLKSGYLSLQAEAIASTHPVVALELLDRYFQCADKPEFCLGYYKQYLAYVALGELEQAVLSLEQAIRHEKAHPGFITPAAIDLPFLVATAGLSNHYELASPVLAERKAQAPLLFPEERFKWNAACALILHDLGNVEMAGTAAQAALRAAAESTSGLVRHPMLGLVSAGHRSTIERLASMVGS